MLSKFVFQTVVYYDCLEYPLTVFEIWKHLLTLETAHLKKEYSLAEVFFAAQELREQRRIILFRGFYVLPGRESVVEKRIREEKISVAKLKRARRLIGLLQWVPFVRMIAIAGSLAMKKGELESDWDFFVVLKQGKIWLGRTWLTGVLQLLGKRRHGKLVTNRACLNYFVTEEDLSVHPQDVFGANEYRYLLPVFDREVFQQFELRNRWIKEFKPHFLPTEILPLWKLPPPVPIFSWLQRVLERLSDNDFLEETLTRWQKEKIEKNPKTALPGSFIQATDHALIFLPHPRGPQIFERFKIRLSEASHS